MAISYVQILNSFVSTEGSDGIMTNYVYYSLLVVNSDGSKNIVEGKLHEIVYLLPFVRTPQDDLIELRETVKGLRQDPSEMVDQKMQYVVDSLYPIPDVQDLDEKEAKRKITEAGLIPEPELTYPEHVPERGIVRAYSRNAYNFKKVNLRIIHDLPAVVGLMEEEAEARLREEGFSYRINRRVVSGQQNGIILECVRTDETQMTVDLVVCSAIPETVGMPDERAVRVLEEAGYMPRIKKVVSARTPKTVVAWRNTFGKEIELDVSIPEIYEAKYVDVEWTNMQDSSGDTYGAVASFNNNTKELTFRLSYTVCSKSKHQITNAIPVKMGNISILDYNKDQFMEPNTKGNLPIRLKTGMTFEALPSNYTIEMETTYGLLRKKDTVTLKFAVDW